jgi:hypothetical protein
LQEQLKVVVHQAVVVQTKRKALPVARQQFEKVTTIRIIVEDRFARDHD